MSREDILAQDTARDIAAARAELTGRRDQLVAEYDERLNALASLESNLTDGSVDIRAAQHRVRQLLGDRGGVSTSPLRAGRTTVGLTVPTAKQTGPITPMQMSPTPSKASAAVVKVITDVDAYLVSVLTKSGGDAARRAARLELSLLLRLRRGLERHTADLPRDVVLLGSVVEYADNGEQIIGDLQAGGAGRAKRLLEHDRALLSELVALGGNATGLKEQLTRAKGLVESGKVEEAEAEAVSIFSRLHDELDKKSPLSSSTLLDELAKI
jgi:hypothetical protein